MKHRIPKSFLSDGRIALSLVILCIPAVFVLLSGGCATVGQDFPVSQVSNIQIGKTTQDDIRVMFGSPWRVGIEDGLKTWTYGKYKYTVFGKKDAQDLLIRFDEHNVVFSYTFSTTTHQE